MANNGFTVKSDRFSLINDTAYYLDGWMEAGSTIEAYLDKAQIPANWKSLSDETDERMGGVPTRIFLTVPGDLERVRELRVFSAGKSGRKLIFRITKKALLEKRCGIQYYLDEYLLDRREKKISLQGWAVSKDAVDIEVLDKDGRALSAPVERYERYDMAKLYTECEVDLKSGFFIRIPEIPDQCLTLRFTGGGRKLDLTLPTTDTGVKIRKMTKLLKKGRDVLAMNGIGAFLEKTGSRLFDRDRRPIVYQDWIKKHLPGERELKAQKETRFPLSPLVSIVVPCYKTPEGFLMELTASVIDQTYPNWELILSDGSGEDSPMEGMLKKAEAMDSRIRAVRNSSQLHIAENTNAAIRAAKGDFIAFCDHDDLLAPNALFEVIKALNARPDADLIYTDEDKVTTGPKYMQPNLKPDYDPDLLTSVNYICHLTVVRRSMIDQAGMLDPLFDGAQDYDFILRATEKTDRIVHVPKIVYHWRFFEGSTAANPESKQYAFEAGRRAIQAHYDRLGLPATAEGGEYPGIYRTSYHWEEKPLVSVLIPNKDHIGDLRTCLTSLKAKTSWPNLEFVIIENNSTDEETFKGYKELEREDPRIKVVRYEGSFNYSAINNFGARSASGDYYLLLNNDTEAISDIITEMMGFAQRKDVGCVGARLYFEDDTIQHAGVVMGWGGVAGHAFVNQKRGVSGYQHRIILQQDMSAVTAACMMVKKSVFLEVGGLTEELAVAFNDIDFCMKIRKAGYLVVYNPYAEMYHYESKSRGLENTPEKIKRFQKEIDLFQERWPEILKNGDPYYNPNLSMITQDFSLKRL